MQNLRVLYCQFTSLPDELETDVNWDTAAVHIGNVSRKSLRNHCVVGVVLLGEHIIAGCLGSQDEICPCRDDLRNLVDMILHYVLFLRNDYNVAYRFHLHRYNLYILLSY